MILFSPPNILTGGHGSTLLHGLRETGAGPRFTPRLGSNTPRPQIPMNPPFVRERSGTNTHNPIRRVTDPTLQAELAGPFSKYMFAPFDASANYIHHRRVRRTLPPAWGSIQTLLPGLGLIPSRGHSPSGDACLNHTHPSRKPSRRCLAPPEGGGTETERGRVEMDGAPGVDSLIQVCFTCVME